MHISKAGCQKQTPVVHFLLSNLLQGILIGKNTLALLVREVMFLQISEIFDVICGI